MSVRQRAPRGLFAEVRSGWRDLKRLLGKLMSLGDIAGEIVVDTYRLLRKAAVTAAKHSGLVAILIAGIGVSSPLTGEWGQSPLASSSWSGWARSVALALLALGLHFLLRRTVRRSLATEPSAKNEDEAPPPPAEKPLVGEPLLVLEVYDESYYRVGSRGQSELVVGRRRWTRQSGLNPPMPPGMVEAPMKGSSQEPPV